MSKEFAPGDRVRRTVHNRIEGTVLEARGKDRVLVQWDHHGTWEDLTDLLERKASPGDDARDAVTGALITLRPDF